MRTHTHFADALSAADVKRHIAHVFSVPAHASEIRLRLSHSPGLSANMQNMLTLTVLDAHGFRGEGHRMGVQNGDELVHDVVINKTTATPGFCADELPAGQWTAIINTHRIDGAEPCNYRLSIDIDYDTASDASSEAHESVTRPAPSGADTDSASGPGWYRGDLHGHTLHSDGAWDVAGLVAWAGEQRLDFVTLTDHNTTSPQGEMLSMGTPNLLTMTGMELTTFHGHALTLGVDGWIDWRTSDARTMPMIAKEVQRAGGLFVIAHPKAIGDPACTGCRWDYADVMPGPAKVVEVWNGGPWHGDSYNELGLARYYGWLNDGHRLVATAGTDIHGPPTTDQPFGFNVVRAARRTREAILDGVRRGHLYLSSGPRLELTAHTTDGQTAMMGEALPARDATVQAAWSEADGASLRIVIDGQPVDERPIADTGNYEWKMHAGAAKWCTVELRHDGRLVTLANPIFFEAT